MRFLHTGDLHLDSAFCSYGARDAARQREDGRRLLARVFDTARAENCQMMLIAGDLFDSRFVSPETAELFCNLVKESGIPVVVSPGNHDPYTENSFYAKVSATLEDKLYVFSSPELQVFDIDSLRVRVFGYGFTSGALAEDPLVSASVPEDNGYLKIFCGHGEVDNPVSRYAPITSAELKEMGFAYSALGHVHSAPEIDERIRYSGFGEGRAFDEIGEGGVWIVDIDGENFTCERKILSQRAFYIRRAEVCPSDSRSDIEDKICALCEDVKGKNAFLRLELYGTADEGEIRAVMQNASELCAKAGIEYVEIEDGTMPYLDGEYLERDTTVRGELYRVLRPKLMSGDATERATALKALRIGLAAIDGKNIFSAFGRED